jgi:hypothetical protein
MRVDHDRLSPYDPRMPRIPRRQRFLSMLAGLAMLGSLAAGRAEASSALVFRFDAGRTDTAHAMALDAAGNIYVAGRVDDNSRPSSFAVIKYSPQGIFQWRSNYAAAAGEFSGEAFAVGVDAAGNVVAAGYILRTIAGGSSVDWLAVSFSPTWSSAGRIASTSATASTRRPPSPPTPRATSTSAASISARPTSTGTSSSIRAAARSSGSGPMAAPPGSTIGSRRSWSIASTISSPSGSPPTTRAG